MSRQFTTPVLLPADPSVALAAATKQYVDLRELLTNKGAASGYCGLDSAARVAVANMPVVASAVAASSITSTSTVTLDASAGGNIRDITATANVTLAAPSNPANGQQLRINVLASGAIRTVTFTGVQVTSGLTLGAYSIPSGAIGFFLLTYSALRATPAWYLTAAAPGAA